jgi:hypothetical protein
MRGQAFQSLVPEHITLREAVQARQDAHTAILRVRRAYWSHIEEHRCRRTPLKLGVNPRVAGEQIELLLHVCGIVDGSSRRGYLRFSALPIDNLLRFVIIGLTHPKSPSI